MDVLEPISKLCRPRSRRVAVSCARSHRCFGKAVALLLSFPRASRSGARVCNAGWHNFEIGSKMEQ